MENKGDSVGGEEEYLEMNVACGRRVERVD
jgi:hypothetical protein